MRIRFIGNGCQNIQDDDTIATTGTEESYKRLVEC